MTATTTIPLAVRTGLALIFGRRTFLCDSGIAAMISTKRGCKLRPYLADALHLTLEKWGNDWVFFSLM